MKVHINVDAGDMLKTLDTLLDTGVKIAEDALDGARLEMQNDAKRSAPWTDRTGNARASIQGSGPKTEGQKVEAVLCIGVSYGVYLELAHGGKYRVVWPTIEWGFTRLPLWIQKSYAKNIRGNL